MSAAYWKHSRPYISAASGSYAVSPSLSLAAREMRMSTFYPRFGKRCVDFVCALAGLIVLSPVLVAVAIAVKLTSPGPAFFRQNRIGRHGEPFAILKFRSMIHGGSPSGSLLTAAGDPRITPFGRWLRATKIDELPQLINVLIGDMSLVGPRPEVSRYVATYSKRQRAVLAERPGITGASINIYEEELLAAQHDKEAYYLHHILPEKLEVDLNYCRHITLSTDLNLIAGTFPMIFGRFFRRGMLSGTRQNAAGE